MPGPIYTASFKGVAVTAQQDFFQLLAPAAKSVLIHGFLLGQSTEVKDAEEEMLQLTTNRGYSTVTDGSGGTTATQRGVNKNAAASGATVEVNNTTKLAVGTGTLEELESGHVWNVRVPYQFWYPPEVRPIVLGGEYWTLELETTPADSITMSGTLWFEVLG